jgi:LmbE family N-acetylglucosaminyl deacetylase
MRTVTIAAAVLVAAGLLTACTAPTPEGPPPDTTSAGDPVDLDVLFVGAHPDDEAGTLSTLGQWTQAGHRSGVVTITRGEGGGNAVGPEEGPALGLLREDEERRAVGMAGVTEVFNLDEVDFFYTVSAPLTQQVWDERDTLERIVRLVRATRPEVLLTMNPAPSPGNHGNHQQAARLAVEAYRAAADPAAFPHQISEEGLQPFAPAMVLRSGGTGDAPTGPDCAAAVSAAPGRFGVFSGAAAPAGRTWAAVERDAQRTYASQGWAAFPDAPTDPAQLSCDRFTLIDARVAHPAPATPEATSPTAIPDAARRAERLEIEAPFDVTAGTPFPVTLHADGTATLTAPAGWSVTGDDGTYTVTPPADAAPGTTGWLTATTATGYTAEQVGITPAVQVTQEPLPQVAEFAEWAGQVGLGALRDTVAPVLTVPSGGSREVRMTVTNRSGEPRSGTVEVELPPGFAADATSRPYPELAPGTSTTVPFLITNTDPALPTSNAGGEHHYRLTVSSADGVRSTVEPALELVPATEVPAVTAAPVVDGVAGPGEYPGPVLDLSRRWEGDECTSADDCSAVARLARAGDVLTVFVEVRDETRGAVLPTADCKRHWRTDSVEIALDPAGASENTATTLKLAVLPSTAEGPPCAARDADNRQGPAGSVTVASTATPGGYTVEAAIPFAELPAPVDPQRLELNLFVYDSDTDDKTGQTRIGWSTWQGVQGDPYRWGRATLPGYTPAGGGEVSEPVVPREALLSTDSPQSIEQAVAVDVPLAGATAAAADASGWLRAARPTDAGVEVTLTSTAAGAVTVFLRDAEGTAGELRAEVDGAGDHTLTVPLTRPLGADPRAVAAWTAGGGTLASRTPVG